MSILESFFVFVLKNQETAILFRSKTCTNNLQKNVKSYKIATIVIFSQKRVKQIEKHVKQNENVTHKVQNV